MKPWQVARALVGAVRMGERSVILGDAPTIRALKERVKGLALSGVSEALAGGTAMLLDALRALLMRWKKSSTKAQSSCPSGSAV